MPSGEKPIVKCSVSNCHYWGAQNVCGADLIMIDVDKHASAHYNEEFAGEEFDSQHKDHAASSMYTCCHTFKPKEK